MGVALLAILLLGYELLLYWLRFPELSAPRTREFRLAEDDDDFENDSTLI